MFSWGKGLNFHEPQTCEIKIEKCCIFNIIAYLIYVESEFFGRHFVMNACTMSADVVCSILISVPHTLD